MSRTLSIACNTCKERLWVGQGQSSFYSGEPDAMEKLGKFLFKHETTPDSEHHLTFEDDNSNDDWYSDVEWKRFNNQQKGD